MATSQESSLLVEVGLLMTTSTRIGELCQWSVSFWLTCLAPSYPHLVQSHCQMLNRHLHFWGVICFDATPSRAISEDCMRFS